MKWKGVAASTRGSNPFRDLQKTPRPGGVNFGQVNCAVSQFSGRISG
jgi:hypothetical protein